MQTIHARSEQSRHSAVALLARAVIDAPLGPKGVPCVYVAPERCDGQETLVAKTRDASQDTRLVLTDKNPDLVKSSMDYLTLRLTSIGMEVVSSEDQLGRGH